MKRKTVWALAAVLAAAVLLWGAYTLLLPRGAEGAKRITVQVVDAQNESREYTLETRQAYLRGALEERDLIQGEESAYGLFVKTVDGYTADESKQEWWCFTRGGETLNAGVDTIPIADGDHFEITLTTGY